MAVSAHGFCFCPPIFDLSQEHVFSVHLCPLSYQIWFFFKVSVGVFQYEQAPPLPFAWVFPLVESWLFKFWHVTFCALCAILRGRFQSQNVIQWESAQMCCLRNQNEVLMSKKCINSVHARDWEDTISFFSQNQQSLSIRKNECFLYEDVNTCTHRRMCFILTLAVGSAPRIKRVTCIVSIKSVCIVIKGGSREEPPSILSSTVWVFSPLLA